MSKGDALYLDGDSTRYGRPDFSVFLKGNRVVLDVNGEYRLELYRESACKLRELLNEWYKGESESNGRTPS